MILKIEFELLGRQESLQVRLSAEEWKRFKTDDINAFLGDSLGYYRAARAVITSVDLMEDADLTEAGSVPDLKRQPLLVPA